MTFQKVPSGTLAVCGLVSIILAEIFPSVKELEFNLILRNKILLLLKHVNVLYYE